MSFVSGSGARATSIDDGKEMFPITLHKEVKMFGMQWEGQYGVRRFTVPWIVTLAYLKRKYAESEEAQEHANSSSLALYA